MSDDLQAWLEQVRDERNQAQVTLQNGDDGPMRLWALRHGHVLIDKCEELADAATACLRFFRVVVHCDECNQPTNPIFNSREGFCVVHAVKFVDLVKKQYAALRAPGGGDRE